MTTPRDLHYACWGGGLPLEMLLEAGAVTKATLCFSSLDIFGQAKRFQAAVEDGTPRARRNGPPMRSHRRCRRASAGFRASRSPGRPAPILPSCRPSRLRAPTLFRGERDRDRRLPSGRMSCSCTRRRPTSDGNIVLVGARAMELVMVPASRQVLVTVDAVVSRDELRRMPAGIVISRHFVSAIAVVPGGAAPTSSLPYYLADFDGLRDWTAARASDRVRTRCRRR